jgi:hypothetical protein
MTDKKPLWKLMLAAGRQGMNLNGRVEDGEAARLRAIADEVAPEESEPDRASLAWIRWSGEQRIRAKLLQAAAEAEGEP